jgi:hypothetical protein
MPGGAWVTSLSEMRAILLFESWFGGCGDSSPRKTMRERAWLDVPDPVNGLAGPGAVLAIGIQVLATCKRDALADPHVFGVGARRSKPRPERSQGRGCCNRPDLREPRRAAGRLEAHPFRGPLGAGSFTKRMVSRSEFRPNLYAPVEIGAPAADKR